MMAHKEPGVQKFKNAMAMKRCYDAMLNKTAPSPLRFVGASSISLIMSMADGASHARGPWLCYTITVLYSLCRA